MNEKDKGFAGSVSLYQYPHGSSCIFNIERFGNIPGNGNFLFLTSRKQKYEAKEKCFSHYYFDIETDSLVVLLLTLPGVYRIPSSSTGLKYMVLLYGNIEIIFILAIAEKGNCFFIEKS